MNEAWVKHNYPSAMRFYKILKRKNPDIIFNDVDEFIRSQKTFQLHKKQTSKIQGHIIAFHENALWFMDLLDMSNYSRQNHGYKWILLCIDTFTRKAYATALKNKSKFEVKNGFERIYTNEMNIKLIITDSGNEFLNDSVQELLKKLKIKHDTVEIGDHNALGLIDRLSRTIKEIIFKDFTERDTVKWVDRLQSYISAYNNAPHRGILNYAPNEVNANKNDILNLNLKKSMPIEHNFHSGDSVRKKLARPIFKKGYKQIWSNRVFAIDTIDGIHAILNNGEKVRLDDLQKVIQLKEDNESTNAVEKADREANIRKNLQKEGIDEQNIIENKLRTKKKYI